jgi:hypothetical protein
MDRELKKGFLFALAVIAASAALLVLVIFVLERTGVLEGLSHL